MHKTYLYGDNPTNCAPLMLKMTTKCYEMWREDWNYFKWYAYRKEPLDIVARPILTHSMSAAWEYLWCHTSA